MEKRIQEDHLQQLALFSEYGRMALRKEHSIATGTTTTTTDPADPTAAAGGGGEETAGAIDPVVANNEMPSLKSGAEGVGSISGVGFAAKAKANADARRAAAAGEAGAEGAAGATGDGAGVVPSQDRMERPFQRLEFLVRDWQVRPGWK